MCERARAAGYVRLCRGVSLAVALLTFGTAVEANGQGNSAEGVALPKKGELYGLVRSGLLEAGWKPVPAVCSKTNVCFEGFPELATDLSRGKTCGLLTRQADELQICISGGVADALPVESATLNPGPGRGR